MGRYELEHGDELLFSNSWIPLQDIFDCGAEGEIAEKDANGQPRPLKHPRAREFSRPALYCRTF